MAQNAPTPANTQTTDNPEVKALQDEVARLDLEKQRAEALKAIALANQAALEASLPKTDTRGKSGAVTVQDGAGYYAELMAYGTLGTSGGEILNRVGEKTQGKTVIVTDQLDLSQQAALWEVLHAKIGNFQDEFDRLIERFDERGKIRAGFQPESVTAVAVALTSFLGAAADIAAFFKVDREIKTRSVTLSERALVAEVAGRLVTGAREVLLPDLAVAGDRPLLTQLDAAQTQKGQITQRLAGVRASLAAATQERDLAKAQWEKLKKDKAAAEDIAAAKRALDVAEAVVQELTDRATRFETVITAFDTFVNALGTAPAAGGKSPLETVAVVDLIRQHGEALLLYLDIPSQGAEIHIRKSVWSSGRVSYIGGSVAVFFLVDAKGKVLVAGSLPRSAAASFEGKEGSRELPPVVPETPATDPTHPTTGSGGAGGGS